MSTRTVTAWAGPGLLLVATALLHLLGIGGDGWQNTYYSAAAQAGAESWQAFLYGASDAPASITVDKPPAALWLMALSVRLLGLSPVAIALPQALLGVATVALVLVTARRLVGPRLAMLAGAAAATTPIAALVFRYDNPDALLTALTALAAYATVRCLESTRARWALLLGATVGLAFLTKQLQALLPLPGLLLALAAAGPGTVLRRLRTLLVAGAAALVTALWWVALVELTPSGSRPWIGGSTHDSFLELTLGYNGLGRLLGGSGNATSHSTELGRTLSGATGLGIGWLLPALLLLGAAGLVLGLRLPRTDRPRAMLLASLVGVTVPLIAYTLMSGIYHSYYSAIVMPPLALGLALAVHEVRRHAPAPAARMLVVAASTVTTVWTVVLLLQAPMAVRPLIVPVLVLGIVAAVLLAATAPGTSAWRAAGVVAVLAALLAPGAASVVTSAQPHAGSGPVVLSPSTTHDVADPQVVDLLVSSEATTPTRWAAATYKSRPAAAYQLASGLPIMPIGGYTGSDPSPSLARFQQLAESGQIRWYLGSGGEIGAWVSQHYRGTTVGQTEVYDLSAPVG